MKRRCLFGSGCFGATTSMNANKSAELHFKWKAKIMVSSCLETPPSLKKVEENSDVEKGPRQAWSVACAFWDTDCFGETTSLNANLILQSEKWTWCRSDSLGACCHNRNQIFNFVEGQFLTKRNSNAKWREGCLGHVFYSSQPHFSI